MICLAVEGYFAKPLLYEVPTYLAGCPIGTLNRKTKRKKAMTNNLESKEVLSAEILNAIDLIIKHTPNAVFGGSIALNAVGLINRKVSDIDLFFHLNENLTKMVFY